MHEYDQCLGYIVEGILTIKILKKLKLLFRLLRSIPHDFKGNITPCDILFLEHDASRNLFLKNKAYSAFIDSAGDYFEQGGCKCTTLADMGSIKVGEKAYRSPTSINGWHFLSLFKIPFFPEKILLLNKYIRVFKESQCKVIVATVPSKIFCKAANIAGIPVFELMHGINYPKEYIEKYYIKNKSSVEVPSFFICFDKVTHSSLLHYFDSSRVIGVKHHLMSRFSSTSILNIPNEWKIPGEIKSQLEKYQKKVLVSLQWGFDGEIEEYKGVVKNGVIHESIINAIGETKHDVLWLIRLHPVQLTDPYKKHVNLVMELENNNKNVIYEPITRMPLPEIFKYCDSHITASSMTCYEAAWLGVKSYAFSLTLFLPGICDFMDIEQAGLLIKDKPTTEKFVKFVLTTNKKTPMPFDFKEDFSAITSFIKREYL